MNQFDPWLDPFGPHRRIMDHAWAALDVMAVWLYLRTVDLLRELFRL